ncbi:MAG: TIR domain-containing protein [Chthoniobacteraceae bacterium]
MGDDFKYWAFISYSHQDNLAERKSGERDCVRWGEWLHRELETYRVPAAFRGRTTPTGEPMPARLFPVFQDEKELPLNPDLAGTIADALRQSRFLIVLCSPRSAASFYVDEEVRVFKQLGRQDRILALIVAGEPNASEGNKAGYSVADECFCPTLRHPLDATGATDMTRRDAQEPIAGDVRVKDGQLAREARRTDLRRHGEVLEFMRLKLLAGVMGVGFDELVQRDKARHAAQLRRRLAILSVVALAIACLAVYALFERGRAVRGERRIAENASRSHYELAKLLLGRHETGGALAHLAEALRNNPKNRVATSFALNLLLHREWPIPEPIPATEDMQKRGAVFSPDGTQLLVWPGKDKLLLKDAATWKETAPPMVSGGDISNADFSRDGKRILTTAKDGVARIWDAQTGIESRQFNVPEKLPGSWLSDEKRLLTRTDGESVRLWDAASGQPVTPPMAHPQLSFADVSSDGARVLTGTGKGNIQLWDAATGAKVGAPFEHGEVLFSATFSSDGTRVITGASDKFARIWDAATGGPLGAIEHGEPLFFARYSPAGERIVTGAMDASVRLWDAATFRPSSEPIFPGSYGLGASISSDGARMIVAGSKGLTIWNVAAGRALAEPVIRQMMVASASMSADDSRVVTAGYDGNVRIWDAATGKAVGTPMKHALKPGTTAFDPDAITAVFNADATRVASTASDGTVRIWDAQSGTPVGTVVQLEGLAKRAAFSPDGRLAAAGDSRGNVRIFDAATGATIRDLPHGRPAEIYSVAFSADGKRLVTAGSDFLAHVWNVESGQELSATIQHASRISTAVFSPDGGRILTTSTDRTARIWNAETGTPMIDEVRLDDFGNSARFSPDGERFVTASRDGKVQVWDSASGQPLAEFGPLSGKLAFGVNAQSAVFSRDGRAVFIVLPMAVRRVDLAGWDEATEDLAQLVESLGGSHFAADSARLVPLPPGQFDRLRTSFAAAGDGDVARVGRWFFSDRKTRTTSPWSKMTVPQWTARRLAEEWSDGHIAPLEELLTANPRDPALLIALAVKVVEKEPARAQHYVDLVRLFDPQFPIPAELQPRPAR